MPSYTEQNAYTFKFSGHESFPCKTLWLKKEYDFVKKDLYFNAPEAVDNPFCRKKMTALIPMETLYCNITRQKRLV